MKYIRVKDQKNLVRDRETQAILNTDLAAVRRHEQRVRNEMKEQSHLNEINNLKAEISEMKQLLKQLASK